MAFNGPVNGTVNGTVNSEVPTDPAWTAIIPIRSFAEGKTRLQTPGVHTPSVIEAFAQDVITACLTCPHIARTLIVSPDPSVLKLAIDHGCEAVRQESPDGINEAISLARHLVTGPVIAVLGDTPCLTAAVLTMVVTSAQKCDVSFVADTSGVGSTMWCVKEDSPARSHFGHHSRAAHRNHGAVELGVGNASPEWARARRDVDTDIDLWDASRLGLGSASSQLLTGMVRQE